MKTGMSGPSRRGAINAKHNKESKHLSDRKKAYYEQGAKNKRVEGGLMATLSRGLASRAEYRQIRDEEESLRKKRRVRYGDNMLASGVERKKR